MYVKSMFPLSIVLAALFCGSVMANTVTDHNKVVVCYISTWAVYRNGSASYSLDNFDPKLCTHAIYAFAGLDVHNDAIKSLDPWQDLKEDYGKGGYEKLTSLRSSNPHLKVLLAIGGWNEGSKNYSDLAANSTRRQRFVKQALEFIKLHRFDGLDLDWEYPTQRGGNAYDRENFVLLVKELSLEFKKNNLLLTSAIGAGKATIDAAYDIKTLSKHLDYLHIMCYDYNGSWNKKIGPNAPLTSSDFLNVEYTVEYLMQLGAPPSKLVVGLPFYGRTFVSLIKTARIGDESNDVGFPGPSTNENGFMGYNEICETLKNDPKNWTVTWDSEASEAIATKVEATETKVVIYDNTRTMANKVRYAMRQDLAGVMIWSVDTDDFNGVCNVEKDTFADFGDRSDIKLNIPQSVQGKYPLLRSVNNAIVVSLDELRQEKEMDATTTEKAQTTTKDPNSGTSVQASAFLLVTLLFYSLIKLIF